MRSRTGVRAVIKVLLQLVRREVMRAVKRVVAGVLRGAGHLMTAVLHFFFGVCITSA
jgi:hypothetical protein